MMKSTTMTEIRLQYVTMQVVELAKTAGAFIRNEAENFDLSKVEHKGRHDMVSYVDRESEKTIVKGLRDVVPEAGFITEEGTALDKGELYKWVIDPLDGTTNFLHRLPPYSVSIALMRGNELLVGVVYEVTKDECFYAWKGGGAYCNGKKIHTSKAATLEESLVVTGFPYSLLGKETAYFAIMQEFVKSTHGMRRLGSAAVDLSYIASGRLEAYYEFNLNPWDVAAGILIVREAGGVVTDFKGGPDCQDGSELLACAKAIHPGALAVIQKHWK